MDDDDLFSFDDDFLNFDDLSLDLDPPEDKHKKKTKTDEPKPNEDKSIHVSHRMGHRQLTRRASSDIALENAMDWHFKEGDCYHCFSFGDVDFLSYVKFVVKQQPVKYMALSTWCMAGEDVQVLQNWYERGIIGRVDLYVGEIFKGSYPVAYEAALKFLDECGGRMVIFRNHAKIAIIHGERFDCLIESSANINTNPRSENTMVTVDRGLVRDYLALFNDIKSFDRAFDDVKPYEIEDD